LFVLACSRSLIPHYFPGSPTEVLDASPRVFLKPEDMTWPGEPFTVCLTDPYAEYASTKILLVEMRAKHPFL
jgi:hypothetical protein